MTTIETKFRDALHDAGLLISDQVFQGLCTFLHLLLKANETTNLTAITDYGEGLYKHIYDALLVAKFPQFLETKRILDVGSGGGIPAIPLALAFPDKQIYSLEATRKKVDFQAQAAQTLDLKNFHPLWNRAEILGHDPQYREEFDLVIARAVAATPVLTELLIPFAKVNGYILLYKGKEGAMEVEEARVSLQKLQAQLVTVEQQQLPEEYGERSLILIEKLAKTASIYPRKPGVPQKKPLV